MCKAFTTQSRAVKRYCQSLVVNLPLPPYSPFLAYKNKNRELGLTVTSSFEGPVWVSWPFSPYYALRRPFSGNYSSTPKCRYYKTLKQAQGLVLLLLEQIGGEGHRCLRLHHNTLMPVFANNVRQTQSFLSKWKRL